jgi:hypothetical protein
MKRRRAKMNMAPMAVASDGEIVINAAQLTTSGSLAAIVKVAERTGLAVFIGVVVPEGQQRRVLDVVDDALADVVGRLGPKITGASTASAQVSARRSSGPSRGPRRSRARRR